jgi:hypothetical protein
MPVSWHSDSFALLACRLQMKIQASSGRAYGGRFDAERNLDAMNSEKTNYENWK